VIKVLREPTFGGSWHWDYNELTLEHSLEIVSKYKIRVERISTDKGNSIFDAKRVDVVCGYKHYYINWSGTTEDYMLSSPWHECHGGGGFFVYSDPPTIGIG